MLGAYSPAFEMGHNRIGAEGNEIRSSRGSGSRRANGHSYPSANIRITEPSARSAHRTDDTVIGREPLELLARWLA
jgi:hypothetical protein